MESRDELIELIFAKCSLVYGRDFLDRWPGIDEDEIKADWARELGGMLDNPHRIKYGLEHLPLRTPSALHFREICRMGPDMPQKQVPLIAEEKPKRDPARVATLVKRVLDRQGKRRPLQWAYDLQERERRGEELSVAQAHAWRNALTHNSDPSIAGAPSAIDPGTLPPGMRPSRAG